MCIRDSPRAVYEADPILKRAVDALIDGTVSDSGSGLFRELYDSLLTGRDWQRPDPYYVLGDFHSFYETRLRLNRDYRDGNGFVRKCFINACSSGKFSSDRTIQGYADDIWKIAPIDINW